MNHTITKLWTFCLLTVLSISGLSAKTLDLSSLTLSDKSATTPQRNVSSGKFAITVSYTIPDCEIIEDAVKKGKYSCHIPGFSQTVGVIGPSLLERIDKLYVPWKVNCEIKVTDSVYVEYPCKLIASSPIHDSYGNVIYLEDASKSSTDEFYAPKPVAICNDQYMRGNRLVSVKVRPVVYDAANSKIRILKRLTYIVSIGMMSLSEKSRAAVNPDIPMADREFLSGFVVNRDMLLDTTRYQIADTVEVGRYEIKSNPDPQSYLIISTSKFKSAVDKLVEWKRTLGFTVHTSFNSGWTSEAIHAKVKELYEADENLRYLLIIGDEEDVPSCPFTVVTPPYLGNIGEPGYSKYSDNEYGCIDQIGDHTQDVFVGRIPVSTSVEADNYVAKLITYEKEPPTDTKFYETIVGIAGFEREKKTKTNPNPNIHKEDIPFIETTEFIRNHILKQKFPVASRFFNLPYKMERIYYAHPKDTLLVWNLGDSVPAELLRPNFTWDKKADVISDRLNKGCLLAFVHTHGSEDSWGSPIFTTKHAAALTNGNRLPIILAPGSCKLGAFKNDCIVESFIRNPNGGAVAMIANTNWGYSWADDALGVCIIRNIWPRPNITKNFLSEIYFSDLDPVKSATYVLGPLLAKSLSDTEVAFPKIGFYDGYIHKIIHIFGDPGMEFRTGPPTEYENLSVKLNESGQISVYAFPPLQALRVSYYDKKSGEVGRFVGSGVTFTPENIEHTVICVHGHNKKTKIFTYADLQNAASAQSKSAPQNLIKSISPSPASGYFNIVLREELPAGGDIIMTGVNTGAAFNYSIEAGSSEISIDTSALKNDTYIVVLKVNNEILDTKKIIVKH